MSSLTRSLAELGRGDIAAVGGKNASLGEMIRRLAEAGVRQDPPRRARRPR